MAVRITHIRLAGGTGHEHISHLWWTDPSDGQSGNNTRAQIVSFIENDNGSAYVQQAGTPRAEVGVVTPAHGAKFLRTFADGKWNNNLLSLRRA